MATSDPPIRNDNSPDAAWGLVPVTGASSNSHPCWAAAAASSLIQFTLSVLHSMSTAPRDAPASAPLSPSHTPREAASSATMLLVIFAPDAASRGEAATVAPELAKGAAVSRFRLYTVTRNSAES